jgi:hypothetical protein
MFTLRGRTPPQNPRTQGQPRFDVYLPCTGGLRSRLVADAFGAPVLRDQGLDRWVGHGKADFLPATYLGGEALASIFHEGCPRSPLTWADAG